MKDPFDLEHSKLMDVIEEGTEFIPLLTTEDEEQFKTEQLPEELPILPLRNMVLFPGVVMPITVGRDKSIRLVKDANVSAKIIGVVAQTDHEVEEPSVEQLNTVGTVAQMLKTLKMPDGSTTVIIQGKKRFSLNKVTQTEPYIKATILPFADAGPAKASKRFEALIGSLKDLAMNIIKLSPNIPSEAGIAIRNIESASFLINFISSNMNADVSDKQKLLEIPDLQDRANMLLGHLTKELQMLELKEDIQSKVKIDIDHQQREFFLQQQMKQIQEELGGGPLDHQIKEFKDKAVKKKWDKKVAEAFEKELDKVQRMHPAGPEYSVQVNYLETLLELPWGEYTKDNFDLKKAQKVLDRDHFGLDKVKERIIEHLAVLKLKGDMKSPILCLTGPPGVGKTSLGKSVAEALGRKYVRMSLGGLRDEAEIRGHRKTYIGALPGRIMQSIKKVKSSNPVFVLDEIDKVGADFHGDPSSALLEVLDPEQNSAFYDNFIELEYDLSRVMFIATANMLNTIQPALRDRLEIIEVTGYTVEEKIEIAHRHLVPKQLKEHGLKKGHVKFSKKVIEHIVENYSRESGVRTLEKRIAKVIRQIAKSIAMEEDYNAKIKVEDLQKYLGVGREKDKYQGNDVAGVVTGLAWTSVGGDILFIESSLTKGKGKLTLTGNLGDVMKESAMIAHEYLKAHAHKLGLKQEIFEKWNVHIHVPEGATPKDGPSAGIAMLTALASAFTQRKVKPYLAMTGEITLRGQVLEVGGIKEKILAAKRADIREVLLSENNRKDIEEINPEYLKGLKFRYVKKMIEVVEMALLKQKVDEPLEVV
ncbi:MAG: endopeptidase La [Flavobacteriales bacterium]|nr:MAG: endopeptidase La [Flavobacteriales bacterium]